MKNARWVVYRKGDKFCISRLAEWKSMLEARPGVKAICKVVRKEDADNLACSLESVIDLGLDIYDPKIERVVSNAKIPEEE